MPQSEEWSDRDFIAIAKIPPTDSLLISEGRIEPMGAGIDLDEFAMVIPRRVIINLAREILRGEDIN